MSSPPLFTGPSTVAPGAIGCLQRLERSILYPSALQDSVTPTGGFKLEKFSRWWIWIGHPLLLLLHRAYEARMMVHGGPHHIRTSPPLRRFTPRCLASWLHVRSRPPRMHHAKQSQERSRRGNWGLSKACFLTLPYSWLLTFKSARRLSLTLRRPSTS